MYWLISIAATLTIILIILISNRILGANKGSQQIAKEKAKQRKNEKLRRFEIKRSNLYKKVYSLFTPKSTQTIEDMNILLKRNNVFWKYNSMSSKSDIGITQTLKAEEYYGQNSLIAIICVILAITFFVLTYSPIMLFPLFGVFTQTIRTFLMKVYVADQNQSIDDTFYKLYTLLYPRLIAPYEGANVTDYKLLADKAQTSKKGVMLESAISNFLEEYKDSRTEKPPIYNFAKDFSIAIRLYKDEKSAIVNMRTRYSTPIVRLFFDHAVQSIDGIDNRENLLGFKQELELRQRERIENFAKQTIEKGNKTIYLIFILVFEAILLGFSGRLFGSGADLSMVFGFFS
jgi:hypothetical protein